MIGKLRTLVQRAARSNVLLWVAGEIFIVVAGVLVCVIWLGRVAGGARN